VQVLAGLCRLARDKQQTTFDQQNAAAERVRWVEFVVGAAIFLLVGSVTWYCLKLNQRMARATEQQEQSLKILEEKEARLQAVVNTAADGIITIDARGTIDAFNPAAERLFGYRAEEVVGQNVNRLMPSPVAEQHDGYLANYLRTRQSKTLGTTRQVLGQRPPTSAWRWRAARTCPRPCNGAPSGWSATWTLPSPASGPSTTPSRCWSCKPAPACTRTSTARTAACRWANSRSA
jgi:PAS domain S-box-containing protein